MSSLPEVPKRAARRARTKKANARKSVQQQRRFISPYVRAEKHRHIRYNEEA